MMRLSLGRSHGLMMGLLAAAIGFEQRPRHPRTHDAARWADDGGAQPIDPEGPSMEWSTAPRAYLSRQQRRFHERQMRKSNR